MRPTSHRAHILVIDGCPEETTRATVALGGRAYGEAYADALVQSAPASAKLDFHVLSIADGERLPQGVQLNDFAGIAWTGSPLSAYDDVPAVRSQIDLARDVYASGVPSFGSCWGLQIMCQALGGSVRSNPKGYEIGIARNIALTDAGRRHVMYRDKPAAFDALAIHRDEVTTLPGDATLLASNGMSRVQAATIEANGRSFWGVQYHPEFDLATMSMLFRRTAATLVRDGFVASEADAGAMAADLAALGTDSGRRDIAWRYGIGPEILDGHRHRAELSRWLIEKVMPRAG